MHILYAALDTAVLCLTTKHAITPSARAPEGILIAIQTTVFVLLSAGKMYRGSFFNAPLGSFAPYKLTMWFDFIGENWFMFSLVGLTD